MTGPYEPRDEFETRLAAAMRAEADTVVPTGDGLARIRARTSSRAGFVTWVSRPAAAGGILAAALVVATLVGTQLAGNADHDSVVVEPPPAAVLAQPKSAATPIANDLAAAPHYNPTPGSDVGNTGGEAPSVDTQPSEPATAAPMLAPVSPQQEQRRSDHGIPVDDGHSTYVSIQAPISGAAYDSPLTLHGQARVFEAQVTIDITRNGTVLEQAHATATQAAPALGEWEATIALAPGAYRIDAYALSPKDGRTRLASDSIWITVRAPAPAPTPAPAGAPSSTPSSASSIPGTPGTAGTPAAQPAPADATDLRP